MKERKEATIIVAPRYQKARNKGKGNILNEFIELTGYGRRYASYVLRSHGKKIRIKEKAVMVGDVRRMRWPKRSRVYDDAVLEVLKKVWYPWTASAASGLLRYCRRGGWPFAAVS